jgi:hypothetical protein
VATVQQAKARFKDGRWDFDFLFFTESDQVREGVVRIETTSFEWSPFKAQGMIPLHCTALSVLSVTKLMICDTEHGFMSFNAQQQSSPAALYSN